MATGVVYKIKNKVTGNFYIGGSVNPNRRIAFHFSRLRTNHHSCKLMQDEFNKYGVESFITTYLMEDLKNPYFHESNFIKKLKPKYNTSKLKGGVLKEDSNITRGRKPATDKAVTLSIYPKQSVIDSVGGMDAAKGIVWKALHKNIK